MTQEFNV